MTNDPTPLDESSLPHVASEAQALRGLLERQSLLYRRTVRPIALEPDEPSLVRAFWNTIGWAPMFERGQIENPDVAAGVARVRGRLAEYGEEEHFTLTEADLPARYRLVYADSDGIGFAVTDEPDGIADPRTLSVLWDDNTIVDYAPSYLRLCAEAVLRAAFDSWYSLALRWPAGRDLVAALQPGSEAAVRPDVPFPSLAPTACRISPAIWLIQGQDPTDCTVAAAGFEEMVAWLHGQDLNGARIFRLPGDTVRRAGPLRAPADVRLRMRSGSGADGAIRYQVGWIADIAVIIEERGDTLNIAVNPRHRKALEDLLEA